MIFNKDKKNLSHDILNSNSVEDTAIDRWRTINTPEEDGELEQGQKKDLSYTERTSFLNSLMKDGPAKARKELFPNDENLPISESLGTISLTKEFEDSSLEVEEIVEEEEFDVAENESISDLENLKYGNLSENEVEVNTLNASAKNPLDQFSQMDNKPEKIEPRTPSADFTKDTEEDLKSRFGANLKSALGEGTVIEGTFSFETPVKVNGCLTGEVRSTSALIVGEKAQVNAKIKVGTLIILGSVEGEIEVSDLVEIRSTGSLFGEVTTKRIALEDGGIFNGACTIIP